MSYKFDFGFLAERWPDFVAGAWLTIQLTVLSIALGFLVGTMCALARVYGGPVLRRVVGAYVETIRNTPLLVQIFIVYFGLSSLGLKLSARSRPCWRSPSTSAPTRPRSCAPASSRSSAASSRPPNAWP